MKLKSKNTVLILVVLSVWIAVSYRFVKSIYPNTEEEFIVDEQKILPTSVPVRKTTIIAINKHLRDPFLGSYQRKRVSKKISQKTAEIDWPEIHYKGSMENSKTGQRLYFVQFRNQMQFWKKGKIYQEVQLIQGNKEFILVKFQGVTQKFFIAP